MKKIFLAIAIAAMGFGSLQAQNAPAAKPAAKPAKTAKPATDPDNLSVEVKAATPAVAPKPHEMKKEGTPVKGSDKSRHIKKDGTPDNRHSENKKKEANDAKAPKADKK